MYVQEKELYVQGKEWESRSLTLPVPPSLPSPRLLFADWIQRPRQAGQVPCSPLTNEPLADLTLRPNRMACSLIATMRAAGLLP